MKVIVNNLIPFEGYAYINLFGIIFTRNKDCKISPIDLNHEAIHTLQMKYLLYMFFYLIYGLEWIIKVFVSILIKNNKTNILNYAYHSLSFEQVAYNHEKDLNYLNNANPYEWIKYIFKMK